MNTTVSKLKLAIGYGGICGGCDVALINAVSEKIADVLNVYEIIYWPIAVDGKNTDVESIDCIDVSMYMGMIRTDEHLRLAKVLREKSRVMVLYGTCAAYGGIPGLSVAFEPNQLMEIVNSTVTTSDRLKFSVESLDLPKLLPTSDIVSTYVMNMIRPNIVVPGCPPSDYLNSKLLNILFDYAEKKAVPKETTILADNESLCSNCPRKPKELGKITMSSIRRLNEVVLEENKCFLEQGVLCMGPATRAGCEHPCMKNNLPCVGCMGPAPGSSDHGLKTLSTIASIAFVDAEKKLLEKGLASELDKIADPLGAFYRYTLPSSTISRFFLKRKG